MDSQNKADGFSVCVLASGSRGNAIYISSGKTSALLDAGLSGIEIERRLSSKGINPGNLDAIIVSHEHADHIQGVGVLSRRFELPVYISHGTYKAAKRRIGRVHECKYFNVGSDFRIKDLNFHPFSISHDAEDPAGFTAFQNGIKIGVATDIGIVTAMVKERLKDCAALIVEANHDSSMLMEGPYPWHAKQRIKSRTGHLSNIDLKILLSEIKHEYLQYVTLAHLSETNNTPQKALNEAGAALSDVKSELAAAHQNYCGKMLRIRRRKNLYAETV